MAKKSVEQLAEKPKRPRRKTRAATKTPRESRSQKAMLLRQQTIVVQRDVEMRTWTEIAALHKSNETTIREAYWRYQNDVAPIIAGEQPATIALSYLRMLEGQRRNMAEVAREAKDDLAVRLRAAHEIVVTLRIEIDLRQKLGLLPPELADLPKVEAIGEVIQAMMDILRRVGVGREVFEEIHELSRGRIAAIEGQATRVGDS